MAKTENADCIEMVIKGRVQGVGFRPYVWRLATELGLCGWVRNESGGVVIHLEGETSQLYSFEKQLSGGWLPPLARISGIEIKKAAGEGGASFVIEKSRQGGKAVVLVPPDTATCRSCADELADPEDRRHLYPFINCTDCGPRFTVIRKLPYDRELTTMEPFPLCPECASEMVTPAGRRLHAQTNACKTCGPTLVLYGSGGDANRSGPFDEAARLLADGRVIAVKGLGGYHLVCDASNEETVRRLAGVKHRGKKPLAVMATLAQVRKFAALECGEEVLLCSPEAPIVILRKKAGQKVIAPSVSGLGTIGVMLPYTPLYHLLCGLFPALVVTSANGPGEPTIICDKAAAKMLGKAADAILANDREIYHRADDSVMAVFKGVTVPYRVSRGYVPLALELVSENPEVLAVGGQQKNTFCFTRGKLAMLGPHLGDMDSEQSLAAWLDTVDKFKQIHGFSPIAMAVDLHPAYALTRWAKACFRERIISVQHHHAHLVSNLAENGEQGPVLGVVFDGLGFGADGTIWGGEFLLGDAGGYSRLGSLRALPLVSGTASVREPWRMACMYLHQSYGDEFLRLPLPVVQKSGVRAWPVLGTLAERRDLSPPTSSAGRLFEAVSAILGLCSHNTYEGEAACLLEDIAASGKAKPYRYDILPSPPDFLTLDWRPLIYELVQDVLGGAGSSLVSLRFHITVADAVAAICREASRQTCTSKVALSGGVFQNRLLLAETVSALQKSGLQVLLHSKVPPNDGGLALGQAVAAAAILKGGGKNVPGYTGKSY